ncbi:RnfABCDGE type electron transport complex subunit B [Megasphaera elsdenii]|uniref:RnfABCDGE type electron transport complex subunit B n=1 Tax=Megasphaera elsdenii TaxID=907 RepID=UPI0026DCF1CA|nr:RnfABCDGE type electron transport complex subunit B [Megasphaera elsdenii]
MDYSFIAIMAVVIMACIGIVFGFILASADKKFAMEENPLIGEVKEALPQGQCGACGFAGCAKYAEAVVLDPNVPPNLCVPGKAEVAAVVAKLTGKVAEATEPKYAAAAMALPNWLMNTKVFMTARLLKSSSRVRNSVSSAVSASATARVPARSAL